MSRGQNNKIKGEIVMKNIVSIFTMVMVVGFVSLSVGNAKTKHETHGKSSMETSDAMEHKSHSDTFKHEAVVKHIRAEFKIMSLASMNMKGPDGATHHVMVNLFDDSTKHPIKDAVGKVKIIGPDEKEQTSTLKNYNGVFAANFTFNEKGKYGVICLLKTHG
jgi:hypothetical protein